MKKLLKLLVLFSVLGFQYNVFAASVDHFDVKLSKDEASVNEAVDITIEALDKNGNVVKDYNWTILILSETDPKAELPKEIKDNSYTFKESDQWKIKFENALKFKNTGSQQLNIYDLSDEDIMWVWEINITWETTTQSLSISITTPEDWTLIWQNSINVSWKTEKNHKVVVKINWKDTLKLVSNNEWIFDEKLENLDNWLMVIKASVLNADWEEVWTSSEVKITINAKNPEYKSIKLLSWTTMDSEEEINIQVEADKWLSEVLAILDDTIVKLTEWTPWTYTWKTIAPKEAWEYDVSVKLTNEMWNKTNVLKASQITVNIPELTSWKTEETTVVVNNIVTKIYKITNLQLTTLKTKSILTWDKISEAVSYNIYKQLEWNKLELIENVKEPRYEVNIVWKQITYDYFVVEPVVKSESWDTIKWELSEATKIQTWPKEVLLMLFLSLILWFIFMAFKETVQ